MQHLNMSYVDVMTMPVYERRFFLGLATKTAAEREEHIENMKAEASSRGSKGSRSTTVSGEALKTRMKNGDIPTK